MTSEEETILMLKHKLSGDVPSSGNLATGHTNRGTKLDLSSATISSQLLNSTNETIHRRTIYVESDADLSQIPINEEWENGKEGYRPRIVYSPLKNEEEILAEIDKELDIDAKDLNESSTEINDFIRSLNIAELLQPITSPGQLPHLKYAQDIYANRQLDNLANQTIHIIEKEQDNVNIINKLMDVFMGDEWLDDSTGLKTGNEFGGKTNGLQGNCTTTGWLEHNLHLPEYDHNLDLDKVLRDQKQIDQAKLKEEQEDAEMRLKIHENFGQPGWPPHPRQAGESFKGKIELEAPNLQQFGHIDPFFVPPNYQRDAELNLPTNESEELRQLIQIALQRNEEFVRSLSKIRNGFVRSTRLRDFVWKWCVEMDENSRANTDNGKSV
ncbi:Rxt2 protein [Martiniozyma asiatica (nom. inval.)]|nr:Rxt2 protein [Martiniozyma asiatica]